jgi:hypothetical protein
MKCTAIGFLAALMIMSMAFAAKAAVPSMINYQGRLTNSVGVPLDTTVTLDFTIYRDSLGMVDVWSETYSEKDS